MPPDGHDKLVFSIEILFRISSISVDWKLKVPFVTVLFIFEYTWMI